jgi:hypothetical protein
MILRLKTMANQQTSSSVDYAFSFQLKPVKFQENGVHEKSDYWKH